MNRRNPKTASRKRHLRDHRCSTRVELDATKLSRWFYEKNHRLFLHPTNKSFREILGMNATQFERWVDEFRRALVRFWDERGFPPTDAKDQDAIIKDLNELEGYTVASLLHDDLFDKTESCVIKNTTNIGSSANQWFPTMLKTRINTGLRVTDGRSIYDHLREDSLFPTLVRNARKSIQRDSLKAFSQPVKKATNNSDISDCIFACKDGSEWISLFEKNRKTLQAKHDYWLEPIDAKKSKLAKQRYLTISKSELSKLRIPALCKTHLKMRTGSASFIIRLYSTKKQVFPLGLRALHLTLQPAVNFPPLTAKFLYERYMRKMKLKEAIVWDPSAGWGGRILGAMSVSCGFKLRYIGTDPNTDHTTDRSRTKYHELADYYNLIRQGKLPGTSKLPVFDMSPNTYEIYQCGSEEMRHQKHFQKYKGKVDIVFTSPPYFAKEIYSTDRTQSALKFDSYAAWRDGFLRPTLETAYEWLRPGGVILWNIANAQFGSQVLPLEEDSQRILSECGMTHVETLKMAMPIAPGANKDVTFESDFETFLKHGFWQTEKPNRIDLKSSLRHFCEVRSDKGSAWMKYEPIFVYCKSTAIRSRLSDEPHSLFQNQRRAARHFDYIAREFMDALKEPSIKPSKLRAIYSKLKVLTKDSSSDQSWNTSSTVQLVPFFVKQKNTKESTPLYMNPRLSSKINKSLVHKFVLAQFLESDARNGKEPCFAWAKVTAVHQGDGHVSVDAIILRDKECAEISAGTKVSLDVTNILLISQRARAFA
jgi:hypothetical protein